MVLFALSETSAGYALFKAKDKKLLQNGNIANLTKSAEDVASILKLKKFVKYDGAQTAVEESVAVGEGKVSPMLEKLLDSIKDEKKASLAVADPKLANAINKLPMLQIVPVSDSTTEDLFRAIREHFMELVPGVTTNDINAMSLGLAHSVSRHKLKFSPEKLDTMIIQAIALLDDLDKELNTYAMRTREWYGWHFPELAKILNDNLAYARVILEIGYRKDASKADLAEILPEELETAVKNAAEVSMGIEISPEDLDHIRGMATQVVEFTEYRQQLSRYLSDRMQAIAPNLTHLVGELVGARLIAHSGSLLNLAKSPASTIQILGAEKALFRALKTKHDTPKYGLIYHASLVGQATGKNKGKMARMLATKTALGLRIDSLADWGVEGEGTKEEPAEEDKIRLSVDNRIKLERQLRAMEGKPLGPRGGVTIGPNGQPQTQPEKWNLKEARKYNPNADGLASTSAPRQGATLIEEVPDQEMADADAGSDSDESDESMTNGLTNGALASSKQAEKEKHKAAKAARKAERAAKREAKAAKKAAKEAAKAAKANGAPSDAEKKDKKKRKHEDEPKSAEKKKKHKA